MRNNIEKGYNNSLYIIKAANINHNKEQKKRERLYPNNMAVVFNLAFLSGSISKIAENKCIAIAQDQREVIINNEISLTVNKL